MKIEWNRVTWYSKVLAIILFVLVFYFGFYLGQEQEKVNRSKIAINDVKSTEVALKDGRQCFTYNHEANKSEPYTVNEFIDITINGNIVSGTKKGTQKGPDMTNGYIGEITGTIDEDIINAVFSYTIEGSKNKEREIYKVRKDKIGIEKLRYSLIEKGGMLVPDTTKEFKNLLYARVGCVASN